MGVHNTFLFVLLYIPCVISMALRLNSAGNCDSTKHYPFEGNVTVNNNIIDAFVNISMPFEGPGTIKIEYSTNGNKFHTLTTMHEKDLCKAFNTYGGELWYDLQRAAKIPYVGACPIRKGFYMIKKQKLDFNRLALQALPKGQLRVTTTIIDKNEPTKINGCLVVECEKL